MTAVDADESWDRIVGWLSQHAPVERGVPIDGDTIRVEDDGRISWDSAPRPSGTAGRG